ncbi:putative short-chain dehydrogenase/reductase SDR [Streptomyces sp. Tu6071]|uniref:SDR family NAD(P)-dependent oxidoreductase n=1 Tax=Streptomyces sp. Tu6071 TaxID=355249 RepID=UPI00020E529F|nr:SDR family oxidoreductase [Streptomyces sp. Tu6071]EGJ73774.1 putative short-chain dehydrogenase/reductase SDR [Streptomyces sp. Tu6071]
MNAGDLMTTATGVLAGRVALVTGAGQGIGAGIARALADEGADVAVLDLDAGRAEAVAAEVGGLAVRCDVSDAAQVAAAVATIVERFGTVDVLVNNAMAQRPGVPLAELAEEDFALTYRVGPLGSFLLMRACFPYLRASEGGGRIVNFRSGSELDGLAGYGAYVTAKGGIAALTRVAAREWGTYGITVNAISPFVLSERARHWFADRPEELSGLLAKTSLRRAGDAEADVGRAVVFLAGPDAAYITGCTLPVDGGGQFFS